MVAGVAAGLADYLEVDPSTVRIAFAVLALVGGVGVPLYLAAWLLLPEEGAELSIGEELADRVGIR
jgi:phage shock protein PspC (stress-responsive transcriptional regulator)